MNGGKKNEVSVTDSDVVVMGGQEDPEARNHPLLG
jgi:hypothetical protein